MAETPPPPPTNVPAPGPGISPPGIGHERPLRITILAHGLRTGGGMVVGQNLLAALARIAPEHDYFVLAPAERGYENICADMPHKTLVLYPSLAGQKNLYRRLWYDTLHLPKMIQQYRPDVILGLGNVGLNNPPVPQAIYLHNAYLVYPPCERGKESWKFRLLTAMQAYHFRKQLARTDLLFCQTTALAQRVQRQLNYRGRIALSPVVLSSELVSRDSQPACPPALAAVAKQFKLFYLAPWSPHKNIDILVDMFVAHRQALRNCVLILTIPARQCSHSEAMLRRIEREGLGEQVINVGALRPEELAAYYLHSDALLMPTLLETVGIPYIEAMYYGLPILTSDLDFARAVCAEAAVYFNPRNPHDICQAILRLRNDAALQAECRAKVRTRYDQFPPDWDHVAADLLHNLCGIVPHRSSQDGDGGKPISGRAMPH